MKKVLSIVLALALVFGFASMAVAMGPSGADPTNVGLVLTSFYVSDSILSPLMLQNWAGTIQPTKTYAEGQPIWFVAHYVQNKRVDDDDRNFLTTLTAAGLGIGSIDTKATVFTSSAGEVNYAYSNAYMNFALVTGIQVIGASVNSSFAGFQSAVSTSAAKLEVTMEARNLRAPGSKTAGTAYISTDAANLLVAEADKDVAQDYYLQIMGFTNACNEAQGTAIAKTPIDYSSFPDNAGLTTIQAVQNGDLGTGTLATAKTNSNGQWLNLYDGDTIKYTVVKFYGAGTNLGNITSTPGTDNVYAVFDGDDFVIAFVSTGKVFKGLAGVKTAADIICSVQYTSDSGGKYVYTEGSDKGDKAIEKADLEKLMAFMGFNFSNDYPVLDKHWEAHAGLWRVLEAKYNVAAAVITNPDPGVDIVPKTGDVSTAFGMIMVAIAGLAAVGFVMMKRVHG